MQRYERYRNIVSEFEVFVQAVYTVLGVNNVAWYISMQYS